MSDGYAGGPVADFSLEVANVPADMRKEGHDWFALFNPNEKKKLDVNLVHTLSHERWVMS